MIVNKVVDNSILRSKMVQIIVVSLITVTEIQSFECLRTALWSRMVVGFLFITFENKFLQLPQSVDNKSCRRNYKIKKNYIKIYTLKVFKLLTVSLPEDQCCRQLYSAVKTLQIVIVKLTIRKI